MSNPDLRKAFYTWLEEVQSRLPVGISIRDTTADAIEFAFDLANPVLIGSLTSEGDLAVSAEWQEECWDFLLSVEARPQAVADGFICSICDSEGKHRTFATLEALWQDHLFDPLEEWITIDLAKAEMVALYRVDTDSTRAKLISAGEYAGTPSFLVQLN